MVKARRRSISQQSELVYDAHEFGLLIDTREIFLSNQVESYDDAMIDQHVANQFIRNLTLLNNIGKETVLVHSITNGGCWNYGMAIYDAIKSSVQDPEASDVIVLSYGHARSMSSIIPQAANWRVIMPHAEFMIHWGTAEINGNVTSVLSEAHQVKKLNEVMLDIYLERCQSGAYWEREGYTTTEEIREFLREKMDRRQEFYMSAREAVDFGFMDAVLGDEEFESIRTLRSDD